MATPPNNSFAPPKSVVQDVAPTDILQKASRAARFGAAFIDGLIFGIPFMPSYFQVIPGYLAAARGTTPADRQMATLALYGAVARTGFWFYVALAITICTITITVILVHRNGQTIGKKLVGIKVVRKDGSRATLARIFWLRYFVNTLFSLIPVIGSLYALVDLLFIFGEAKRCCHDYIADTIVIQA